MFATYVHSEIFDTSEGSKIALIEVKTYDELICLNIRQNGMSLVCFPDSN